MNALYLLLVIGWLATLVPIVTGSYCTQTYTCTKSQRYTTSCGFLGWKRCTRYRNVNSQCSRQVCCNGWTGAGCKQDVNECLVNNGGCQQTCVNEVGSFHCECSPGFTLHSDGKTCVDKDECALGVASCHVLASCVNTQGSFFCVCDPGYTGDGITCTDIDECALNNGGCDQVCLNEIGSFSCDCKAGYRLMDDGVTCQDLDECSYENGGCAQVCKNLPGSYQCECNPGYQFGEDGITCEDLDECVPLNNGGCDQVCLNNRGSFSCDCNVGYQLTGDGVTCQDIDECQQNICSHFCTNTNGSFTCTCQAGYLMNADGVTCDDVNECSTNNGGCAQVCNNLPGSFRCECSPGYQFGQDGITCEDINECNSFNGGCQDICENTLGSFVCKCNIGELSSDGLSCEATKEPSVFQRNSIARKLLPRGCAVVTLTRCTEGADVEVRLSSTAEWYKLTSDPNIIFTLGIVFIEVNDIALPMSITGMEIHNPNGNFMMQMGSLTYGESDGTVLATDRNNDCLSFNLTPRDVFDFVSSGSFLSTFLENIYKALPNWIKFTSTGFDILSINQLKTDLLHGRDVQKVQACRGAPLFDNKLYTIFQFRSGFSLSVYGNEISLPKPLNGTEFCLIVDICRAYGGTVFLMFPPGSRELLSQLKVISDMEEKGGFKLFLNGIGLSIVKEINVHYTASELTFWNGDGFFQYPVFPKAHMWLGGGITKNTSVYDISAETDIYLGFPRNPLSLLSHVFLEEWNAIVRLNVVASCTLKFKLLGKQRSIRLQELGVSSLETHISVGGLEPRQWCGANANPPGIFLSLRLSINPFRNIPILGDWVFYNRHSVYAFVTYDQSGKIKNLPTVDLLQDIVDIQQIVNHFMEVLNQNLERFKGLLSNTAAALLNLVHTALADLKAAIQEIVGDLQNLTFPDFSVVLDTIRNAWTVLKMASQNFLDAVEFNIEIAKHNFTEMIKFEVNRIKGMWMQQSKRRLVR
ncbi:uncharacterized protein LOC106151732 isoform X2 [Lingula anatina]|uniref:Uncharacterized protein LOC106151732 isoform X2 n=1 Tax=Lingula anatina TaxID=7574 RepID=A0A1S3H3I5_LINAN|nr:uncharacterized protein LOC106151732 isoform X2 [Lingula anatina]|eukprot:XP_013380568.1 uncharacterized protein LOC106151732 isoform X2 [Lingula anatina]